MAETHLEMAKLSSVFPYLKTSLRANTSDSVEGEALPSYVPGFYASAIWQQLEQIYQQANGGNELAFNQLYDLTDDSRLSVPVHAVATYFLGKLWTHDRALSKLCNLAREGDEMWAKSTEYTKYMPIRIEAMNALQATGTPQAWEALIEVIFLDRASVFGYHEKYLRWLTALTSQLDPSILFEPVKEDRYNNPRPWFDALTEATDDIDKILKDL